MFEETLELLVLKSITSMEEDMCHAFDAILKDALVADTFDKVYEEIKKFFTSDALNALYDGKTKKEIQEELEILKPIAALYCCYFGMDYIYQKSIPEGEKLDVSYIKDLYDCSADSARDVYNIVKGSVGPLNKIKEFEDTLFVNPSGYQIKAKREKKDISKSHIYLGNIKLYLDKACESDSKHNSKHLIMKDLVPSITFIALRSLGSLPNGTYVNRTKDYINVNAISTIDSCILGKEFIKNDSNFNIFNVDKVKYKTSPEISRLLNLAAVDDVYRLDRLNAILVNFISYIEERKITGEVNESDIAMASSLLLSIPLPMLPQYFKYLKKLFEGIEHKDEKAIHEMCREIFRFTSVTFPYLIGLLCYLLFFRLHKPLPIEEIKKAVSKLELYLQENNGELLHSLNMDDNRIWLCGKTENAKKYISKIVDKKGKYKIEWKKYHEESLGKIIEIILSPKINDFKISTLANENFLAYPTDSKQKFMKFWYYGLHGIQLENKDQQPSPESDEIMRKFLKCGCAAMKMEREDNHKMYKPEEYVLKLTNDFQRSCHN